MYMESSKRRAKAELSLSSDIITREILPRLPVKTLCRFRCVSKSWYHLLSSSDPTDFLQLHWRRSKRNPTLLVLTPDYGADRIPFFAMKAARTNEHGGGGRSWVLAGSAADLGFDMRPMHRKAASACHGLALVYNDENRMRVWNPATGERIDIKVPLRSYTHFGAAIGYVESTGEYKALVFYGARACKVLTIGGSAGWRAPKKPPPFGLYHHARSIAVVDGFVHVLPASTSGGGIARFDLEKEDWSVIPGIDPCRLAPRYEYYDFLLREVNGSLCLVQFSEVVSRCRVDIWLLKEEAGVWAKECTIDVSSYHDPYLSQGCRGLEPLMIEEDGRILFTCRILNSLFYYDPKTQGFHEIYKGDSRKLMLPILYS